jgi:hypothetical protein
MLVVILMLSRLGITIRGNPYVENPSVSASGWILALEAREIDDDDNRLRMYIQGHNTRYVEQAYKNGVRTTNTG